MLPHAVVFPGAFAWHKPMIRAVLFDLDGTLRSNRPSAIDAFFEFASELGVSSCANGDARRNVERWVHSFWSGKHSGVVHASGDPEAFWNDYTRNQLVAAGVQDGSPALVQALRQAFYERYHPVSCLDPEAPTILSAFKEGGYTLGLVSNRAEELAPVAETLGLGNYFHFTLSGGQANSYKPDTRIFLQACEMAHAEPGECLYVGDNYYADAVGAQAAGLAPVLLDPNNVFPEAGCMRIARLSDLSFALSRFHNR
jgi:HAD superfamily hydrolase (TIGR01549 family)